MARTKVVARRVAPTVTVLTDFRGVATADLLAAQAAMRATRGGYWDFPRGRATFGAVVNELDRRGDGAVPAVGPLSRHGEHLLAGLWDRGGIYGTTCGGEWTDDYEERPPVTCHFCGDEVRTAADHRIATVAGGKLVDAHRGGCA